jgi:WD40 repeat protein
METWEPVRSIPVKPDLWLVSPNGRYLVSLNTQACCDPAATEVVDLKTWKTVYRSEKNYKWWDVSFSSDSRYLVTGSSEANVILDTNTWQEVYSVKRGCLPVFSPDAKYLAACSLATEPKRLLEAGSWKEVLSFGENVGDAAITFSPDSKYVFLNPSEKRQQVFKLK